MWEMIIENTEGGGGGWGEEAEKGKKPPNGTLSSKFYHGQLERTPVEKLREAMPNAPLQSYPSGVAREQGTFNYCVPSVTDRGLQKGRDEKHYLLSTAGLT